MKKIYFTLLASFLFINSEAQVALGTGLAASYSFTGNANNDSGPGLDGTVVGATLTTDRFGNPNQAYKFNGTSNYINFGNILNSVFAGTGNKFTISAWFKPASSSMPNNVIIVKASDAACSLDERQIYFRVYNNKMMFSYASTAGPGNYVHAIGNTVVNDTSHWYHVVAEYDGTIPTTTGLDRVNIYVDNVLNILSEGTPTTGTIGNIPATNAAMGVGTMLTPSGTPCGTFFFNGKIDDIRIYNRPLNTAEINAIYTGPTKVGIKENKKDVQCEIFPNPTSGILNYSISNVQDDITITVFDVVGKKVYCKLEVGSNSISGFVDLSSKPKGVYFFEIETTSGKTVQKVIITD